MRDEIDHDALQNKCKVERDLDFRDAVCQRLKVLEERQEVLFEKVLTLEEMYEKRSKKRTKSNIHNNRRK